MFQDGGLQLDEELVREQLARNIAFLGEEGVEKLRKSFVIIVGAGMYHTHPFRFYIPNVNRRASTPTTATKANANP